MSTKKIDFNEDDDWLDNLKMEKKLIKVKKLPKLILEVLVRAFKNRLQTVDKYR